MNALTTVAQQDWVIIASASPQRGEAQLYR